MPDAYDQFELKIANQIARHILCISVCISLNCHRLFIERARMRGVGQRQRERAKKVDDDGRETHRPHKNNASLHNINVENIFSICSGSGT